MDIAKSMYLGGQEINAENSRLNAHSFRELGLRCAYCGEPVSYRKGDRNRPHFAHLPSMDPRKYEECLMRQKATNGRSLSTHPWWQSNGSPQRLELFQKHFFYILRSEIRDLDIKYLEVDPQDTRLTDLENQALEFLLANKTATERYLKILNTNLTSLEIKIILEVLDYITKPSSTNIFKSISDYAIRLMLETEDLTQLTISPGSLCSQIFNLIESISWLKVLIKITDENPEIISKSIDHGREKINFARKIESESGETEAVIYFHDSGVWLSCIYYCCLIGEQLIIKIDLPGVIKSEWLTRKVNSPIFDIQSPKFLRIDRLYIKKYETSINHRLMPDIRKSIIRYLEGDQLIEVSSTYNSECEIYLEKSINDLLRFRKSEVFLLKGSSKIKVAEISIDSSAIKYKENHVFNGCIKPTNAYYSAKHQNSNLDSSVVDLLQDMHRLFMRNRVTK